MNKLFEREKMGKNRKTDLLAIGIILIAIGICITIVGVYQDMDENSILSRISEYAYEFTLGIGIILIVGGAALIGKQILSEP